MLFKIKKALIWGTAGLILSLNFSGLSLANQVKTNEKVSEAPLDPFEMSNLFFKIADHKFKKEKGNKEMRIYVFGFETPIYENYLNYGCDFTVLTKGIGAFDTSFFAKVKAPLSLGSFGHIGLFAQGNIGISSIFNLNVKPVNIVGKFPIRFGTMTALSVGLEYYPITWFGFSLENQSRYYNYLKYKGKKHEGFVEYTKPFKLNVSNITVLGLKLVF